MVFKDCLYFQINKFMEKRAWPLLFLFLTTILQKSTCNFWLTQWTSASPGLPKGFVPDPSSCQLCFISSREELTDCLGAALLLPPFPLLWGKEPPPSHSPLPRMPLLFFLFLITPFSQYPVNIRPPIKGEFPCTSASAILPTL